MRVAVPPAIASVYRSPSSSNTIVRPSGETSSESHVPSEVVKSTLRVGVSGSESVFLRAVSAAGLAAGAGCCAGLGGNGRTAARDVAMTNRGIIDLRGGGRGENLKRRGKTSKE